MPRAFSAPIRGANGSLRALLCTQRLRDAQYDRNLFGRHQPVARLRLRRRISLRDQEACGQCALQRR